MLKIIDTGTGNPYTNVTDKNRENSEKTSVTEESKESNLQESNLPSRGNRGNLLCVDEECVDEECVDEVDEEFIPWKRDKVNNSNLLNINI